MTKELILRHLKENNDYISGEDLSRTLGISRSAVWKNVNALREDGYEIESVTNRGYRLASSGDALTCEEISSGLNAQGIGAHVFTFQEVDSTNEEAKRQGQTGAPHGSVFVAEVQTGGKGRLGRAWSSPPKTGVWFTILVRPEEAPDRISNITLLAGLSVCRAIRSLTGCSAEIKWPNDVVINGKKVCGILAEMAAEFDRVNYVVVGIGVNVNNDSFPEELSQKATSLRLETGRPISRVETLRRVLEEFGRLYDGFFSSDQTAMLEEYKKSCVSLNRRVSTVRNGQTLEGTAVDITLGGELAVRLDNGTMIAINSGEVSVQGIYGVS